MDEGVEESVPLQVYGDVEPQQWTSQWQDVMETEGMPTKEEEDADTEDSE